MRTTSVLSRSLTISTSGQHGIVAVEAMESAIFHAKGNHTDTLALVHDQVEGKILHKVGSVVAEGLCSCQRNDRQDMSRPVHTECEAANGQCGQQQRSNGGPVLLFRSCSSGHQKRAGKFSDPRYERRAFRSFRAIHWLRKPNKNEEGHLNHSGRSLFGHVVDGILITEPVTALDRVVPKEELGTIRKKMVRLHVPSPVVLLHVAKSSINASL